MPVTGISLRGVGSRARGRQLCLILAECELTHCSLRAVWQLYVAQTKYIDWVRDPDSAHQ